MAESVALLQAGVDPIVSHVCVTAVCCESTALLRLRLPALELSTRSPAGSVVTGTEQR